MDPYPLSLLENSNSVRRSSVLQKLATPPFSCSRQTRSYRKNSVDLTTQMSPLRGGEWPSLLPFLHPTVSSPFFITLPNNLLHSTPIRTLQPPQHRDHLVVDPAVGGDDLFSVDREWVAREIRDAAAGLFENHKAGGGIPGMEVHFPKAVCTSKRNVAQIQSGGTGTAHSLTLKQECLELTDGSFHFLADRVREARQD